METMKTLTVGNNTYDITDDGAIRFDNAQSLTETQQSQARMNMGIIHDAKYYLNLSTAITDINNGANTNALTDISAAKVKVFTAENGHKTVMLLDNVAEGATISIGKDIDLVLNGKTLTFTATNAVLDISSDIVCHIYGDVPGSAIVKSGFNNGSSDLITTSAGTLHIHGGKYANEEVGGMATTLKVLSSATVTADRCEIVATTKKNADTGKYETSDNRSTYLSMAVVAASTKPLALYDVTISSAAGDVSAGFYARGTAHLTNCNITAVGARDVYALNTMTYNGDIPKAEFELDGCEFHATTFDTTKNPDSITGIKCSQARCVSLSYGVLKARKCKFFGDSIYNDAANETCAYGISVFSNAICFLEDCYVFGTMNGVSNQGKLYISGGTFTGHSHGGFYFAHGADGEAFVKDAVIRCGNYEGIFTEEFADGNTMDNIPMAGFYVGGGNKAQYSNVTVYLDGCTIGYPYKPAFVIRGSSGEQNCTVNISNSTIVNSALPIRIDNATHKLNVGIDCNITTDKIGQPQWAEFTGKNYRKYNKNETVDGNGYDALQGQISNISGDEWFEITDITTTEEVNSIYVDKDKAGNSFVCKKIVARLVSTSALAAGGGIYIGGGGNGVWEEPGIMYNINPSSLVHTWSITDCNGLYHEYVIGRGIAKHFMDTSTAYQVRPEHAGVPLTSFFVGYDEGTKTFPAGVNLKIWGLRA